MMYGLPSIFFFILYEGPSGLFVYWIFQNMLQVVQQQFVNRHLERLKLQQAKNPPSRFNKPGNGKSPGNGGKGKPGPKKTK